MVPLLQQIINITTQVDFGLLGNFIDKLAFLF
jgi:hypothetical protein